MDMFAVVPAFLAVVACVVLILVPHGARLLRAFLEEGDSSRPVRRGGGRNQVRYQDYPLVYLQHMLRSPRHVEVGNLAAFDTGAMDAWHGRLIITRGWERDSYMRGYLEGERLRLRVKGV